MVCASVPLRLLQPLSIESSPLARPPARARGPARAEPGQPGPRHADPQKRPRCHRLVRRGD
eukprot:14130455-Alexandrium_andersonii.AAC.1